MSDRLQRSADEFVQFLSGGRSVRIHLGQPVLGKFVVTLLPCHTFSACSVATLALVSVRIIDVVATSINAVARDLVIWH